jgi:hypothetical protein
MKILTFITCLVLIGCSRSSNISDSIRTFVVDEDGRTISVKEIQLDERTFYITKGSGGCWILGPEKK